MVDLSKQQSVSSVRERDWGRAMSDHVAYALLAYTGVTIFVTIKALQEGTSSTLPYFAFIALIAAIIPACRWFEKRWAGLDDDIAHSPVAPEGFRRDTIGLWLLAVGLPLALTALFKAILAVV
jgi:hypothetical protein